MVFVRSRIGIAAVATTAFALVATMPAGASVRHHARHRHLARHAAIAPLVPAAVAYGTPPGPIPGQNGVTTDTNIFPDLSIGDAFGGYQTPGLGAYGLQGGGLYGSPALR